MAHNGAAGIRIGARAALAAAKLCPAPYLALYQIQTVLSTACGDFAIKIHSLHTQSSSITLSMKLANALSTAGAFFS